jgi:hypothetical protein
MLLKGGQVNAVNIPGLAFSTVVRSLCRLLAVYARLLPDRCHTHKTIVHACLTARACFCRCSLHGMSVQKSEARVFDGRLRSPAQLSAHNHCWV